MCQHIVHLHSISYPLPRTTFIIYVNCSHFHIYVDKCITILYAEDVLSYKCITLLYAEDVLRAIQFKSTWEGGRHFF
jgi:hypothetical protein